MVVLFWSLVVSAQAGVTLTNGGGFVWRQIVVTNSAGALRSWFVDVAPGGFVGLEVLPWGVADLGFVGDATEHWERGLDMTAWSRDEWAGTFAGEVLTVVPASSAEGLFAAFMAGLIFGSTVYGFRWQLRILRKVGGEAV